MVVLRGEDSSYVNVLPIRNGGVERGFINVTMGDIA